MGIALSGQMAFFDFEGRSIVRALAALDIEGVESKRDKLYRASALGNTINIYYRTRMRNLPKRPPPRRNILRFVLSDICKRAPRL